MHWFIKLILALLFISCLILSITHGIPKLLPEQRIDNGEVRGLIFSDQIWSGDIRVTGDILAMPGSKISILPGTNVLVSSQGDKNNFDILPWHNRSGINTGDDNHGIYKNEPFWDESQKIQIHLGIIEAKGTKEQPIVIRSDTIHPSPYDFNLISIQKGVIAYTSLSNYRRLEIGNGFSLRDSILSQIGECAICTSSANVSIVNNSFFDAYRESIWINGGSAKITDNLFLNRKGSGIILDPRRRGSPIITNNTFEMPDQDALVVLTGEDRKPGVVSNNIFSGNSRIRLSCDSRLKISDNSLLSIVTFIGTGCGGKFTFGPNYWGTMDLKAVLGERITNKDRNFEISIPSMLTSPPTGAGRRS